MALNFPNSSRSYDLPGRCVRFWGYDSVLEISFNVDEDVLTQISPSTSPDEASLLRVFDVNRGRIQEVAGTAYSRRRRNHYRLSASDF